jgi:hypothetical protein
MGRQKNRCWKKMHPTMSERLESRRLYSVVTVNPSNYQQAINASNVGDTIEFSPGNYVLPTNPSGAAEIWPGGRQYVGNGAVLSLSDGMGDSACTEETVRLNGNSNTTQFTGFVVTDAQIDCENGSFNVQDNTFENGVVGIFVANVTNSQFNDNSFSQLSGGGIYGYPGNGNSFDANNFNYVYEPIHLSSVCIDTDVSDNVITNATRMGIELQNNMSNMTVDNNWIGDWSAASNGNGHMAISCSTGGDGVAPYSDQGQNITISGNTLLGIGNELAAIEIMGNSNINLTNNYCSGWWCMELDGTMDNSLNVSNNIEIGTGMWIYDGCDWPMTPPQGSGNQVFSPGSSNAPSAPSPAQTAANVAPAVEAAPAPAPVTTTTTTAPAAVTAPTTTTTPAVVTAPTTTASAITTPAPAVVTTPATTTTSAAVTTTQAVSTPAADTTTSTASTTSTTTTTTATATSVTPATATSPTPGIAPAVFDYSKKTTVPTPKKVAKVVRKSHPGTAVAVKKQKHTDLKKKSKLKPEFPELF